MAESKRVSIRFPPKLYAKMEEKCEELGFKTLPELIRESVEFYLEHNGSKDDFDVKTEMADFLKSEEGRIWFSTLLDDELVRRSEKQMGIR